MDPMHRIIDANANRTREALRVLEDIARFALNNSSLSSALKSIRHDFQIALEHLPIDRSTLIASRDTPGDVGTSISTASEGTRLDLHSLAAANASRLTEALRSIEESTKLLPGSPHTAFETLRYRAYEADRILSGFLRSRVRRSPKLCVLITESLCTRAWIDVAQSAIDGGADAIQLREKSLDDAELLRRASLLSKLCESRGVPCFINDRPDIALLSGAHGVHLGQSDLPVRRVRELAGTKLLIGLSTGNLQEALDAHALGADLCGVGPMFETTTKQKNFIAGKEYLQSYLRECSLPHLAIGGISTDNLHELVRIGCKGIAVSSCVCRSSEPDAVCAQLLSALNP